MGQGRFKRILEEKNIKIIFDFLKFFFEIFITQKPKFWTKWVQKWRKWVFFALKTRFYGPGMFLKAFWKKNVFQKNWIF
jgi:hypothetical protein